MLKYAAESLRADKDVVLAAEHDMEGEYLT